MNLRAEGHAHARVVKCAHARMRMRLRSPSHQLQPNSHEEALEEALQPGVHMRKEGGDPHCASSFSQGQASKAGPRMCSRAFKGS